MKIILSVAVPRRSVSILTTTFPSFLYSSLVVVLTPNTQPVNKLSMLTTNITSQAIIFEPNNVTLP